MINKVSSTIQVGSYLHCLANCTVSPICDSYNYHPSDRTCQFNTDLWLVQLPFFRQDVPAQHRSVTRTTTVLLTRRACSTPICDSYNYRPSDKTCQFNTDLWLVQLPSFWQDVPVQHRSVTRTTTVLQTRRASSTPICDSYNYRFSDKTCQFNTDLWLVQLPFFRQDVPVQHRSVTRTTTVLQTRRASVPVQHRSVTRTTTVLLTRRASSTPICDSYNYRPSDKTCQFNTDLWLVQLPSFRQDVPAQHRSVTRTTTVLQTRRASSTHTTLHSSPTRPTLSSTTLGSGTAPPSPSSLEWHRITDNFVCTEWLRYVTIHYLPCFVTIVSTNNSNVDFSRFIISC